MRVWYFFSHKSHNEEGASFFIYHLQKKQVLLKSKSLLLKTTRVLQRILTIFVKSKELSTASPNFSQRAGAGAQLFSNEVLTFWNQQVYLRRGFLHLGTLRLLEVEVTVLLLKKEKQILLVPEFSKNCCDACDERGNFEGCCYACFLSVADVGLLYRS